jgi:hypothetical protein
MRLPCRQIDPWLEVLRPMQVHCQSSEVHPDPRPGSVCAVQRVATLSPSAVVTWCTSFIAASRELSGDRGIRLAFWLHCWLGEAFHPGSDVAGNIVGIPVGALDHG